MIETEFHAHRGPAAIRSGRHCTPDDDRDTSFHQTDDAAQWTLDVYNAKHTKQLVAQGCTPLPSTHSAGQLFVLSTRELIQFLADSEGIAIEFRKRKKRQLSDEQKQELGDRMRRMNAQRTNALI